MNKKRPISNYPQADDFIEGDFLLGSYNNGEYSQYFNGDMGIVRIYGSELSSSDVLTNFNANREQYGL